MHGWRATFKAVTAAVGVAVAVLAGAAAVGVLAGEVGDNDFRISDMGPDGDTDYWAITPAVAYNSVNNEYLVVWVGDDDTAPLVDGESEVFGQLIDGATGAEIGSDFRISDMGPNANTNFSVNSTPAVAYNSTDNTYLVVWSGDEDTAGTVGDEFEIFGQLLDADGGEIGVNDFRISDLGPDGDRTYQAFKPAVAYNSVDNQYLVVWHGEDNTAPLVDNEREIFGQLVDSNGAEVGDNDFRISDMGPDGDTEYAAFVPAVTYNRIDNTYLVVWRADDNTASLVNDEFEVFGQLLDSAGAEIGANDFRVSDMGPDGDTAYDVGTTPAVAHNAADNTYLVIWNGDDNTGLLVENEFEIFGQLLSASGSELGVNDFRISTMGPDGDPAYDATGPQVEYNSTNSEWQVIWNGADDTAPLVAGEFEVFGQTLDSSGNLNGASFRISDMGPDGNIDYDANFPALTYNTVDNEYMVVWEGDDNTGLIVENEFEIFGQRWQTEEPATNVTIDIQPRDPFNRVNLRRRTIELAVLTDAEFDATTIAPATVAFGPAEASVRRVRLADVDRDRDLDLLLQFSIAETGLTISDTEACLTGATFAGGAVEGCDDVIVLAPRRRRHWL